jgi:acyl transferase domain-containing protein
MPGRLLSECSYLARGLSTPLAVVGFAFNYPGNATTTDSLWDIIVKGQNVLGDAPKDRFQAEAFRSESANDHKVP